MLKVQRTLASQDGECQVPAAAAIGLQNLSGCSQSWDRLPECRLAALCTARSYGQLASLNAPEAVIALVDRKEAVPLNWT